MLRAFPQTYTLGAMNAAQIFKTAREQLPGLDAQIADGDFAHLKARASGPLMLGLGGEIGFFDVDA